MDLNRVIEVFAFSIGKIPNETYLISQMREAIDFLNMLNDELAAAVKPVEVMKVCEHPSKTDPNWVAIFMDIINRLLPLGEKVTRVMVINYFNSDDEHLHRHVAQYHLCEHLMGIEVIEMVEAAVTNREIKNV